MLHTDINHNAVTFEDIKNCVFSCLDQDSTVISSLASQCLSIFLGLWVSFFFSVYENNCHSSGMQTLEGKSA